MNEKKRARAEKRAARAAAFEKTCAALKEAGYAMRDRTISVRRANWLGFLCGLPFAAVFFGSMWFLPYRQYALTGVFLADVPLFFVLLAVSIPVHECLHALFWAAANRSFAGISFGISNATPYCACGILCAGGDILVAGRAIFSRASLLCDHPERCGFYAFYAQNGAK